MKLGPCKILRDYIRDYPIHLLNVAQGPRPKAQFHGIKLESDSALCANRFREIEGSGENNRPVAVDCRFAGQGGTAPSTRTNPSSSLARDPATDSSVRLPLPPPNAAKGFRFLTSQTAACSDTSVPLMIIAGSGSGKVYLLAPFSLNYTYYSPGFDGCNGSDIHNGLARADIAQIAMTFTIAAASEMRDQIGIVAGKAVAKEIEISTFHSFCLQLCRKHAEKCDGVDNFSELSDTTPSSRLYNTCKTRLRPLAEQLKTGINGDETGALILENYDKILSSCNALDFHDFISSSVKLLTDFPEVYNECLSTWKAIVIDEFQDTSSLQYGLLSILASHNRVTIIGDEDQVRLKKNYRSTKCIGEVVSALILNNNKRCCIKQIETDNSCGSKVSIKEWHNEDAQCAFVIDKILEMTSHDSMLTSPLAMLRFFTGDKSLEKHPKHVCKTGEYLLILMGLPFIGKRSRELSQLTQGCKVLFSLDMISTLIKFLSWFLAVCANRSVWFVNNLGRYCR
ncbi:hypothetical protein ZIOFF_041368 [Zingiber officinale]|uniref:UvrD-like helicase ATP-binding domain-containing protein n=1 Tax=Zingiber officinale TaxID=94328 RepID=A0A8J5GDM8_ZINOF|nr:hypothetical protein ZIOFF_041368 [Zingiber officinale]